MNLSSRNILLSVLACGSVAAIVIACGSDDSKFDDGAPPNGVYNDGSFNSDVDNTGPDLYANDPPPPWCGPDGGAPPPIKGTEECPEDKNKPGCGCDKLGEEAACWTGLRKHRNLGICKDGRTKCLSKNETSNVWGPCEGEVLPVVGAKGADACGCFSRGIWNITNTSPCLYQQGGTGKVWAYSTVQTGGTTVGGCDSLNPVPEGQAPTGSWSTDTLKVDCAGTFKLCYRIRAGVYETPSSNDCVLGEVCIDADYPEANVEQALPDLGTWAGADPVCAKKWEVDTPEDVSPGYGEMIVKGKTVHCEAIDDGNGNDFVFHRVKYCPRICRPSDPHYTPDAPQCLECQLKSKGEF